MVRYVYIFLYIFLCMHTLTHMMWFWLYYNILFYIHLSRGSWHTELPPVDFWGFLWHHALARHMEPQPLLSYASKVPCWKSRLGSLQKALKICVWNMFVSTGHKIFAGKVVFRTLPCLICQSTCWRCDEFVATDCWVWVIFLQPPNWRV